VKLGGVRRDHDHVADVFWLGKPRRGVGELVSLRRVRRIPEAAVKVWPRRVIEAAVGQQDEAVLEARRHPAGDREEEETMTWTEDRDPGHRPRARWQGLDLAERSSRVPDEENAGDHQQHDDHPGCAGFRLGRHPPEHPGDPAQRRQARRQRERHRAPSIHD